MKIKTDVNEVTKTINQAEKLTVEKLRNYPGFEGYSDDDAKNAVNTIELYCDIVVKLLNKRKNK